MTFGNHTAVCSSSGCYATEAQLVQDFLDILHAGESPWGSVHTTTEWDYRTGITDVLIRTDDGSLVAFEAKLTDWKKATHQAYRNTTFVERVYVVMPPKAAERASRHSVMFGRYGVGLCSVESNRVSIVIEAPLVEDEPILPWMKEKAHSFFDSMVSHKRHASNKRHLAGALPKA